MEGTTQRALSIRCGSILQRPKTLHGLNNGIPLKLRIDVFEGMKSIYLYDIRYYIYIRLMEKDNKKAREDARRDYNDTVRVRIRLPLSRIFRLTRVYPIVVS